LHVTVGVAMSGGVDSTTAAALLLEQGYEVVGFHALQMPSPDSQVSAESIHTLSEPAQSAADKLNIPLEILDYRQQFHAIVLEYFQSEYLAGRTPNPCIVCNRSLRWELLYRHVRSLGCDYRATGHYARITESGKLLFPRRGIDRSKDQSYFLSFIPRSHLEHTLFPIGSMLKEDVKRMALALGLPASDRSESQDLCFIPHGDYRQYLIERVPASTTPGPVLNQQGEQVGTHRGLAFYTIGQRKGLGISATTPFYVIEKDTVTNTLYIGTEEARYRSKFAMTVPLIHAPAEAAGKPWTIRTRYRGPEVAVRQIRTAESAASVILEEPLADITPGQAGVFFFNEFCLGGGFILP